MSFVPSCEIPQSASHLNSGHSFTSYLLLPTYSATLTAQWEYTAQSGTGTPADPYTIATPTQLSNIRNNPAAHHILLNDITLTAPWTPIPNFTGTLNGNGHTLSNLTVTTTATHNAGLFSAISAPAIITNLHLANPTVTATHATDSIYAGALAGINNHGTITHCSVTTPAITATTTASYETIYAGGLVGVNIGTIHASAALNGTVTANNPIDFFAFAGGLAGRNGSYGNATITDSYATTTPAANSPNDIAYSGGLAAYNDADITRTYATSTPTATGNVPRPAAHTALDSYGDITHSYHDTTINTLPATATQPGTHPGITGLPTTALTNPATYAATWNLTTLWAIDNVHPHFCYLPTATITLDPANGTPPYTATLNTHASLPLPTPARPGHTFLGWQTPDGTLTTSYLLPITSSALSPLTAQWQPIPPDPTHWHYDPATSTLTNHQGWAFTAIPDPQFLIPDSSFLILQTCTASPATPTYLDLSTPIDHGAHTITATANASYGSSLLTPAHAPKLTHLTLPDTLTNLGNYAFNTFLPPTAYPNFTTLTIPPGTPLTRIGNSAFNNCTALTGTLTLPDTLTTLGNSAFNNCNLTGPLNLPPNLTDIGNSPFAYNTFTTLTLPTALDEIDTSIFANVTFTHLITLPPTLTDIGTHAFAYATFTTGLILSDTGTHLAIDIQAFHYTTAPRISLPPCTLYFNDFAFQSASIGQLHYRGLPPDEPGYMPLSL